MLLHRVPSGPPVQLLHVHGHSCAGVRPLGRPGAARGGLVVFRGSIRSFSVGDWAGLNGLGGEAEELATRAYAPELLTLTLHGSGSAAFREGGQARYGFLSTLLRLPKELSLSGKRSLSNASCFQEARRKVTQLRHGVYAALLLAKANGRQLSGHRNRGRERPRA